jgi:hypothetical protein
LAQNPSTSILIQATLKRFPIYDASGQVPRISDPLFTVGYGLASSPKSEEEVKAVIE